ncbi:MAG: CSLREA domain-containing protein, partial [Acidobacteria bacterium]|nr:CSLREA domain-containing protein [Acidobacteriota bacterium]
MHKPHIHRIALLALTVAIFTLTLSFARWRAQAERGSWRNDAAATVNVPAAALFATITVNTTADENNVGAACSLREAIVAANTNAAFGGCTAGAAGLDTIQFNLGAGTPTINVLSALPTITEPVTINGNTGGSTRVELNGIGAGGD